MPNATDTPTQSQANVTEELKQQGDGLYALITLLFALFPPIAYAIFPGGEMGDKTDAFLFVYIATLPLSVAFTAIFLMMLRTWLETDRQRLIAAVAILAASAVVGWGFGTAHDLQFFQGVHGPPIVWLFALAYYILATYAVLYGFPLFAAGIIAGGWAAHYLNKRLPRDL